MNYIDIFGAPEDKFTYELITDFVQVDKLPNAPKGWDGGLIGVARSDEYFGMVTTFTIPIEYVLDGAIILREALYRHGTEANVQLRIKRLNPVTKVCDLVYQGDNDFSKFEDNGIEAGQTVSVSVVNGGLLKAIKAFGDVKYTIPLNVPDAKKLTLTPIKLKENAQFIFEPFSHTEENNFPGISLVTNEQRALVASVQGVPNTAIGLPDFSFSTIGTWFYKATVSGIIKITGQDITGDFGTNIGTTTCNISIYNQNGTVVYTIYNVTNHNVGFNINFAARVSVSAGDRLFIYVHFTGPTSRINVTDGTLICNYTTISEPTSCLALTPAYIFQYLCNKMSGVITPVQSTLLKTWENLLFTSGNSIKPFQPEPIYSDGQVESGLTYFVYVGSVLYNGILYAPTTSFIAGPVPNFTSTNPDAYVKQISSASIIISWKDFYQSINSVIGCGFGMVKGLYTLGGQSSIVDIATIEAKGYWMQSGLTTKKVGNVAKMKIKPSSKYTYSGADVGYEDQTYDQYNGTVEINSKNTFTFPIKVTNKVLNLVSPCRADSIGAEILRVGLNNSAGGSSNTSANNDTWMIYSISDGLGGFIPEPVSTFTGIIGIDTNIYNLRISPGENFRRHADFIAGCLYFQKGESIKFTSGLKNVNLSRIGSQGVVIRENADIPVSSLGIGLFIPIEADITINEGHDMLAALQLSPTGCIYATGDNIQFNGFIEDMACDPNLEKQQDVKLLLSPNNNPKDFIR